VGRRGRLPTETLERYLLDVPHPRTPPDLLRQRLAESAAVCLDGAQLFGNDCPVEIEVGFGKGLFLLNESRRCPNTNFLGIEIERKYVLLTADRLARRETANVRLACTDALWLLRDRIAAESVAAVHVYFPDPWWKKRHRKRRLFTLEFAQQCVRVLQPSGRLHFVSDVAEYFAETQEMLRGLAALRPIPWPEPLDAKDELDYLTNFERKYRKEGRPIYRAMYERIAPRTPLAPREDGTP
jgi:tRNA (guanine-N7-)-methyltransferase